MFVFPTVIVKRKERQGFQEISSGQISSGQACVQTSSCSETSSCSDSAQHAICAPVSFLLRKFVPDWLKVPLQKQTTGCISRHILPVMEAQSNQDRYLIEQHGHSFLCDCRQLILKYLILTPVFQNREKTPETKLYSTTLHSYTTQELVTDSVFLS